MQSSKIRYRSTLAGLAILATLMAASCNRDTVYTPDQTPDHTPEPTRKPPIVVEASIEQMPPELQHDAKTGDARSASSAAARTLPVPEGVSEPIEIMKAHIATVSGRPEHGASAVKVQHILIAHAGAGLPTKRPIPDAEALAAETYLELIGGADFEALMKERSDDPGPGVYGMTQGQPLPGYAPRKGMVPAFGNVAWRLAVGEIGVAPHHPKQSPHGWHIIQRVE